MDRKNYKASGVDVNAGERFVDAIKPLVKETMRPEVLTGIGGFAGLFALGSSRWKDPVLVAGTDGVGTKLLVARQVGRYDTLGIDLVAMCVNDVVVTGAEPLFFLDYLAAGKLDSVSGTDLIRGIVDGCKQSHCALLGGETAEMPGLYPKGDFDLAGFAVGIVERDEILDGSDVRVGDAIIGIGSSGIHANGYSLVRKILFDDNEMSVDEVPSELGRPLGDALLEPTRIYVKAVQALRKTVDVHALSHITGGGFYENVPRALPDHVTARIAIRSWPKPAIFPLLQRLGNISDREMFAVFNCGIGMVASVDAQQVDAAISQLDAMGMPAWQIGEVTKQEKEGEQVVLEGV